MSKYTIESGTFFTDSPEIRINCNEEDDIYVQETIQKEQAETAKGHEKNYFLRPTCDTERDGHLTRLKGVLRLHEFLMKLNDIAELFQHGGVSNYSTKPPPREYLSR